jgi:hypothetical protein
MGDQHASNAAAAPTGRLHAHLDLLPQPVCILQQAIIVCNLHLHAQLQQAQCAQQQLNILLGAEAGVGRDAAAGQVVRGAHDVVDLWVLRPEALPRRPQAEGRGEAQGGSELLLRGGARCWLVQQRRQRRQCGARSGQGAPAARPPAGPFMTIWAAPLSPWHRPHSHGCVPL